MNKYWVTWSHQGNEYGSHRQANTPEGMKEIIQATYMGATDIVVTNPKSEPNENLVKLKDSPHLAAAKQISLLVEKICECFQIVPSNLKIDTDEEVGLVFKATIPLSDLVVRHWSDADFIAFCKENELDGIIFFNHHNHITFSMTPRTIADQQ